MRVWILLTLFNLIISVTVSNYIVQDCSWIIEAFLLIVRVNLVGRLHEINKRVFFKESYKVILSKESIANLVGSLIIIKWSRFVLSELSQGIQAIKSFFHREIIIVTFFAKSGFFEGFFSFQLLSSSFLIIFIVAAEEALNFLSHFFFLSLLGLLS